MENFGSLLITVINLFILIIVGYIIKLFKLVDENTITGLNKLIFSIFIPVKIMMSFYHVNFENNMSTKFVIYLILTFTIHIIISYTIAKFTNKDKSSFVVEANAMNRGNFIIMSFPILSALYGNEGIVIAGIVSGLSQFFYNFYTVSLYESVSDINISKKTMLINIMKTPLMIGFFAGLLIYLLNINLFFLEDPINKIGNLGGTLALITMGYGINLSIDFKEMLSLLKVSFVKLIIFPLSALLIASFFDLNQMQKVVSLILFGAPTAINTYVFAKKYNQKPELAGHLVLITTIFYMGTVLLLQYFV